MGIETTLSGVEDGAAKPFFSVVIPLYNKERYVARALNSVLTQTFTDYEVVVVDDGSTDGGAGIVASFADARIRLVRQANGGVSAARNRGIAEARGEWIAFLDADDEYLPQFLEAVHECSSTFPEVGVVYSGYETRSSGNSPTPAIEGGKEPILLTDYFRFLVRESGPQISSSCIVVRSTAFSCAGGFAAGVKIGEDTDMWLRLAWTAKVVFIPRRLAVYHLDASGSGWETCMDLNPFWYKTYREWSCSGRIPKHLVNSTAEYHQWDLFVRTLIMTQRGRRSDARKAIGENLVLRFVPPKLAAKTFLCAYLPMWMMRLWWRRKVFSAVCKYVCRSEAR